MEKEIKINLDEAIGLLKRELLWDECFVNQLKADKVWKHYKNLGWEETLESYREAIKILEEHNG